MFNWKWIVVPLFVVGILLAALALIPLTTNTVVAAPPAQGPDQVPVAIVNIVPVAANAAKDPNVITGTIKAVTDTAVGEYNITIAMGATGLPNVPINVPVHIACNPEDPKVPGKPAWSLLKPAESKATLVFTNTAQTEFTPDVSGWYAATCNLGGCGEVAGVRLFAGTFIGVNKGECKNCHPQQYADWSKTGHANIFTEEIDVKPTHYTENCASCHNVGYYVPPVGAGNGGWKDVMTKIGWKFPTFKEIEAGGNWAKMPDELKNVSNIQCENCHGPAADHVTNHTSTMAVSQDEGVCNVCHNGSSRHDKGEYLKNAAHSDKAAAAFNIPVGIGEQACVRCHSGDGYASFLDNPTNPAAWKNNKQTIVCSTCHDPHSAANPWQLRVNNKPVAMPFEVTKDVGLSATCFECHNSRANPANAIKSSFPHYSSVAEFISNTGGVTYGQTVQNSPHGDIVGGAPIPNPAAANDPEAAKFMFSAAGDEKGNIPGPCVTCHMTPGPGNKDPNYQAVGGHSFNTVNPKNNAAYTAACQTCHAGIKDFNFPAKADYDGNGKTEGVQDEVKGLLNVLWTALADKGVKKIDTGYPYATLPKDANGQTDDKIDNAWYNFRTVYGVMWGTETGNGNEGKAQAMHNFKRAVELLQLSYKDLTGNDVPGATLIK